MPPRLSVIIPCYNSEATLGVQLSALAAQVCRYPWEAIIVDNGSRDATSSLARSFADRIPALRVVDASAARGSAFARNAPLGPSASVARTAYDLSRHLAWRLMRVRSRSDAAQWIWLAGWCGGLVAARRRMEPPA